MRDKINAMEKCQHVVNMLDVAEHRITIPLLSIMLLSFVQSVMISTGEFFKGVLCILGQSQSLKTTLAKLYFDILSGSKVDISFESTRVAIMRKLCATRDRVFSLDDLKPGSTRAETNGMADKLNFVLRICGDDGDGYEKAAMDGSTVAIRPYSISAVTAEEIPLNVYSSLARMLIIEINRMSVNLKALTHHQKKHSVYRDFVRDYILYISEIGVKKYCADLQEKFLRERHGFRGKVKASDVQIDQRTNDMCLWLYISFDRFLQYALKIQAITQEQMRNYQEESSEIFTKLMEEQSERLSELDDISRFFRGLRILLDTNEAKLEKLNARNAGYDAENAKSAIGFKQGDLVYLKNEVAYFQVAAHFRKYGKEFALSESALRRMLNGNGYLVPKSPKSLIHRKHVSGGNYQCIAFEKGTFYRLLKGGEQDDGQDSEVLVNRIMRENANKFIGRGN